ncbi:hypothetical protein [Protaetiibacter mangrovi]|uniref:Large exoprotein n=1 Tax=Protaetiibacter mangrovi TaxID=2970926 RepID=A0ABT1ZDT1_9MICO|nr:hypothetical protein [Protaetiibacter mangrovi]MCS0498850.1 hypothetical protein [Protaetiibacter mangrovi]
MDFQGAGTAIMLALAAVLWFLYLLPSWMRRREFLATERNATRLQRAIRVMAESAEAPQELHLEATAREVAHRERLLAQEQRRADATARAEVHAAALRARAAEAQEAQLARASRAPAPTPAVAHVAARSVAPAVAAPALATTVAAFARLRRARRVAGLLLLAAALVGIVQIWLIATTGVALGSWIVIGACVATVAVSVRLQNRIAERARALAGTASEAPPRRGASTLVDVETPAVAAREWTPVPVPKPLYLERAEPPRVPVVPQPSAEQLLRAAREEAERALAAAHAEPEVVPFRPREAVPAAPAAAPSRFASMGIVEDADASLPDLDEVLRRRRLG